MDPDRPALTAALKLRLICIAVAGLIVAGLALVMLAATGPVTFHLGAAVALGTFFTFLVGGGLFALSFYSARSGFDAGAAQPDDEDHTHRG
ncbi:hypothetical protein [Dongia sp.]|uniref:hypothetical protein n=1 Tax=Dongia sp. TaxID=1977262 RepID=UPI0037513C2A